MTRRTLSARGKVAPFLAMDVLARAAALERAGRSVIHMEVGQPGAPVPPEVLADIRPAFDAGRQGYTEAVGIAPLRSALSDHYRRAYGIDIAPGRFIATTGSSGGFTLAFLVLFEPGARIGLPVPGYPAYRNIMTAFGLVPCAIRSGNALTCDALRDAHRTQPLDGLLIASPNNPTGTVIAPGELNAICQFCREADITLVSDEIYHGLVFGIHAASALEFDDDAIVVSSFSKYFCMTGWRIGWMVVPDDVVRPIERLAQSLFISAPDLSQQAGVAALRHVEAFRPVYDSYARNRAQVEDRLRAMGLQRFFPMDGAFYCFVDVSDTGLTSNVVSARLLDEGGLAATPGADFDTEEGARYLRLSYAGTETDVGEGLNRLETWLSAL